MVKYNSFIVYLVSDNLRYLLNSSSLDLNYIKKIKCFGKAWSAENIFLVQ